MSKSGNIAMYIATVTCILGAAVNIFTYCKLKGTNRCGTIMILSTLVVCGVMIICVDSIVYYMIAMATVVMSMAYMNMKITLLCGVSTMLIVIGKIVLLITKGKVSTIEAGTTFFTLMFILTAVFYVTKLRMFFNKENLETVEESARNQVETAEKMTHVSEDIISNFDEADC